VRDGPARAGARPARRPWSGLADATAAQFATLQTTYPALADYAAWFRLRAAARARDRVAAEAAANDLLALRPTIWEGPAALTMGLLEQDAGEPERARGWLEQARNTNRDEGVRWNPRHAGAGRGAGGAGRGRAALALAGDVRRARPRALTARRARRLEDRLRRSRPDLPPPNPVDEAEQALREGDPTRARRLADEALGDGLRARSCPGAVDAGERRARRRRAGRRRRDLPPPRALGARRRPGAPRVVDRGAVALERGRRRRRGRAVPRAHPPLPVEPQVVDGYYAIARIQQEEGRHTQAVATYEELARKYPRATVADEARWRAAWVRYLAGQLAAAEKAFAGLTESRSNNLKIAAEYCARAHARAARQGGRRTHALRPRRRGPPDVVLRRPRRGAPRARAGDLRGPRGPAPTPFPPDLAGRTPSAARALQTLGLLRLARRELDAARDAGAPPELVLEAYEAIGARGPAIRLARAVDPEDVNAALYPLGYWDIVLPASRSRGLDPLFVSALIRQESLFDRRPCPRPTRTASCSSCRPPRSGSRRRSASRRRPTRRRCTTPSSTSSSAPRCSRACWSSTPGRASKVLAAYNAGEDAVAKWERRYAGRDSDEFVELISYRETRDYVKTVLANYRRYKRLYAASA
jgi:soluble lytic murein transglycosylase